MLQIEIWGIYWQTWKYLTFVLTTDLFLSSMQKEMTYLSWIWMKWLGAACHRQRTEVFWVILFVCITLSVLIHWRQEKLEITLAFSKSKIIGLYVILMLRWIKRRLQADCRNCVSTFHQSRGRRRMWSCYLPLSSREYSNKSSYLNDKIGCLSLPSKRRQMNMFWSEAWKKDSQPLLYL